MPTLHIEHPISDLRSWLAAFPRFQEARQKARVPGQRVLQAIDHDEYVEQAAGFKAFLETTVWSSREAPPALAGPASARILTDADTTP